MKVVYIAGKFRGANAWEVEENIRAAERLALEVWRAGMAALCPHANTRFFDKVLPDEVFLAGTLALMEVCDAVMMADNWRESVGACAERDRALDLGKPIFESLEQLKKWNEQTPERAA